MTTPRPPLIIELDDTIIEQEQESEAILPSNQSNSDLSDSEHSFTSISSQNSGSLQNTDMTSQNSAVAVQKIAFWSSNPSAWFRVIETQFTVSRITEEVTKFNHVISMLDQETINKCMDILENLSSETPYTEFRAQIISRLSESEQSRLNKVLSGTDLGDRKPSELLSHMQSLAGDAFKAEALKTLWLSRLPPQMRAILAVSSEELPKLALLGDKIMETMPSQTLASASINPSSSPSHLEQQISQLSKKFDELKSNLSSRRDSNRTNNRQRNRSRSKSRSTICYFHRKFGEQARKCTNWCTFKKGNTAQPKSGNGQTGQ